MKDDWIDLSNLGEICYFDLGILLFLLKLLCIIYRRRILSSLENIEVIN